MSICWRPARLTSLSMSTLSTSIRWEYNFLLKLWVQSKSMFTTQITKLPKYFFFRPRLPHVPTRRVVFPRASSLETSRQVLEPPPQVENSLPCQNWTLFIPQCISSDSAATISSHFLSSHPHPMSSHHNLQNFILDSIYLDITAETWLWFSF